MEMQLPLLPGQGTKVFSSSEEQQCPFLFVWLLLKETQAKLCSWQGSWLPSPASSHHSDAGSCWLAAREQCC